MMRYLLFFGCILSTILCATDDEMVVVLKSKIPISSVYIAPVVSDQSLKEEERKKLDETLIFDFEHNGRCRVMTRDKAVDDQVAKSTSFNPDTWRHLGAEFVIKPQVENNHLKVDLFNVKDGMLSHFKDVPLSSLPGVQNRAIHRMSDALYEKMFGEKGVAGSQILYAYRLDDSTLDHAKWSSEIFISDYDGSNPCSMTQEDSYSISPVLSPDMKRLLYVCYKHGQPKIYATEVGKMNGSPVISLSGNQLLPAVSPKGDMIAYICDASGRADLFIQNFDPNNGPVAKPIQLYSFPKSVQASPTFSPDGRKIAFVSDKAGNPTIYLIDLDKVAFGSQIPEISRLTKRSQSCTCPSWSPDGKKIAFSAKTEGTRQIWIYDLETGEENQLTTGPGHKENASWAPNSLHLVYNTTSPSSDLYIINLNQQIPVKITSGPGIKHYPFWAPVN